MLNKKSIVTVIGGSGFLGIYVVRRLAQLGLRIQVLSRNAQLAGLQLKMAGEVGQVALVDCNVNDLKAFENHISKSNYIINLVGIMSASGAQNFENLHHQLPRRLALLCKKYSIKKLIHVSALGVDLAKTSQYASTKLLGEKALLDNFPLTTIIRPSVMYGPEDNFLNMYNTISKFSPFIPLIGDGSTLLQPIYVDDVAKAIIYCLNDSKGFTNNKIYEIAGPTKYTFRLLLESLNHITHRKRIFFKMPLILIKAVAIILSILPKPPIAKEQINLSNYNNILLGDNGLDSLGIEPTSMEIVLPSYID